MNDDVYYKAMLSRDYRFDGKFFIGVKTTGIYCRPICPAKPKRENVEFFHSYIEAENRGYRPCMRCRPECAPLSSAWYGKSAVVKRALRQLSLSNYINLNEDDFAEQFGVSARHLRRLFNDEIGQTPKQIFNNNRLNFSRKLICESNLSITAIAFNSGFKSLRRFNDAFKKRFHKKPSDFRKKLKIDKKSGIKFSLSYRPPFDWKELLTFYTNHLITGVEKVSETHYERVFKTTSGVGHIIVTNNTIKSQIEFEITVDDTSDLFSISQKLRKMFDIDSDPILIANSFFMNKGLKKLWKNNPGLRIARGWDIFEQIICTILGQLVSVKQARILVAQLVENYGETVIHPLSSQKVKLFPSAEILAKSDLKLVKTTEKRRESIREVSNLILKKEIILNIHQDTISLRNKLLNIKGIGEWTADYILLRGLGDTDAFPKTDLILKRALIKHKELNMTTMQPWRSYVAVYFWKTYASSLSKLKVKK
jgi:AraC family transcriptional regulator of adaptative response / DNA-3-methyladenine glycosylase II